MYCKLKTSFYLDKNNKKKSKFYLRIKLYNRHNILKI